MDLQNSLPPKTLDEPILAVYDPQVHEESLQALLESRGMGRVCLRDVPILGFIAFVDAGVVAAGFLRQCEGKIGILDSLITHPDRPGPQRHQAIDLIVSRLIKSANEGGYSKIIAFSVDASTLERSIKHGFIRMPHTLISLLI